MGIGENAGQSVGENVGSSGYTTPTGFGDWQLAAGHFMPSLVEAPLEIIQPQPLLTVSNRYYKQYPGIEYNVRVGVIGGSYPYLYELTTSPAGMTIDSSTGEITWNNPVESGSPHNIVVKVTDQELTTDTVSWTLIVNTSNIYFVDSNAATSGTGTISDPFKTWEDARVGSLLTDTLYFRTGTYLRSDITVGSSWHTTGSNKWLAFPGETPAFDFDVTGTDSQIQLYGNDTYIDGLIFFSTSSPQRCIATWPNSLRTVFRRNTCSGIIGAEGQNPSYLFNQSNGGSGSGVTTYSYVESNTVITPSIGAYLFLMYSTDYALIENNNSDGVSDDLISPKDENSYIWIRRNELVNHNGDSISKIQSYNTHTVIVYEYNNFLQTSAENTTVVFQAIGSAFYYQRNTFYGLPAIDTRYGATNINFKRNVIVNNNSGGNPATTGNEEWWVKWVVTSSNSGQMTFEDNIAANVAVGVIDSNGLLTGTNRTTYLGILGHEVA